MSSLPTVPAGHKAPSGLVSNFLSWRPRSGMLRFLHAGLVLGDMLGFVTEGTDDLRAELQPSPPVTRAPRPSGMLRFVHAGLVLGDMLGFVTAGTDEAVPTAATVPSSHKAPRGHVSNFFLGAWILECCVSSTRAWFLGEMLGLVTAGADEAVPTAATPITELYFEAPASFADSCAW